MDHNTIQGCIFLEGSTGCMTANMKGCSQEGNSAHTLADRQRVGPLFGNPCVAIIHYRCVRGHYEGRQILRWPPPVAAQYPVAVVNSHRFGHVLTRLLLVQPTEAANDDEVTLLGETCCGPI